MEIVCEKCRSRLNIPVEKIPKDQRVIVRCPKCKNKLTLEGHETKGEESVSSMQEKSGPEASTTDADYEYEDSDFTLSFFEEGAKLALIMENEISEVEKLGRAVEKLGYRFVPAHNTRDAMGNIRFHGFDLMILCDRFDGMELAQSPILQYLNHLPISIRRRIFLTLIGDTFKTMDHMMAFAMSANLVINRKDLDTVTAILEHAVADNEKFYKVFIETLAQVGKA